MSDLKQGFLSDSEIIALVKRLELLPKLIRRQQEELIVSKIPFPSDWIDEQRRIFLGDQCLNDVLHERGWSESDLLTHLCRSEGLRRFARQRFGPGLEDSFYLLVVPETK